MQSALRISPGSNRGGTYHSGFNAPRDCTTPLCPLPAPPPRSPRAALLVYERQSKPTEVLAFINRTTGPAADAPGHFRHDYCSLPTLSDNTIVHLIGNRAKLCRRVPHYRSAHHHAHAESPRECAGADSTFGFLSPWTGLPLHPPHRRKCPSVSRCVHSNELADAPLSPGCCLAESHPP
ncbi:hypothetical protein L209DRAFT_406387 [Thermothelomyces heterothallicus CBS 203.75]